MNKSILFILLLIFCFQSIAQEKRLALVIGNADYANGVSLKNPVNDANLMASTLEDLGFDVIKHLNTTKSNMEKAMYDFSKKIKDYKVALFYYAGHGILVEGVNYLIPTDATLEEKMSTQFEAVDISKLITQFDKFQDNINIVILDACRNNPYGSWSRGSDRGFKPIPATSGSIIAYATGMGAAAADGDGENGLYTSKLVEQMKKPQRIEDVFIKTRIAVRQASDNTQSPQEWSQLTGAFYFKKGAVGNVNMTRPDLGASKQLEFYGGMTLKSDMKGGIFIDGEYLGNIEANAEISVDKLAVGLHDVEVKGLNEWKQEVYVKRDEVTQINASLTDAKKAYFDDLRYKVELGVSVNKLLSSGYSIMELLEVGVPEKDFYGIVHQGGTIFYINPDNGSGLVAAINDQKDGDGVSWDQAIDLALDYESEGFSDWHLPTKDVLNLMFLNLKQNNVGNFANGIYWSSSVGDRSTVAWRQEFVNGYQYENYNYLEYSVRAVRAFEN